MNLSEVFKRKGFKYKYVYTLGSLDDPNNMNMVDGWEKDLLSVQQLEEQKRTLMKNYKKPVLNVEVVEL
ncbi:MULTISPECIES: hypothetical protein [unclassified Paenibacillus]|uniref:hypothetical protein n=1 Tax=unclassified Paenibacillus TaxID=185978 RepID=UPI00362FDB53